MSLDAVVDRFVAALQESGIDVEPTATAPSLHAFEQRLPRRFPASYASLLYRYRFAPFDWGGIRFFGNACNGCEEDLIVATAADSYLGNALVSAGLLQIGRPDTGRYDPVCFDTRGMKNRREYPLVVIDHEPALQRERVVVIRRLDDSFLSFMLHNGAGA